MRRIVLLLALVGLCLALLSGCSSHSSGSSHNVSPSQAARDQERQQELLMEQRLGANSNMQQQAAPQTNNMSGGD